MTPRHRTARPWLATLLLAAVATPSIAADDAAWRADVLSVLATRQDVRTQAQSCEAMAGDRGWVFRLDEFLWEAYNAPAFGTADASLDDLPKDARAAADGQIAAQAAQLAARRKPNSVMFSAASDGQGCRALYDALSRSDPPHALLDAASYQRLEAIHAARIGGAEAMRQERQGIAYFAGCAKQYANKIAHPRVESIARLCVCLHEAELSSSTQAERDEDEQFATAHGKVDPEVIERLRQRPWMQKAIPKMRACAEALPPDQLPGTGR
jgi:hypothetical protein